LYETYTLILRFAMDYFYQFPLSVKGICGLILFR